MPASLVAFSDLRTAAYCPRKCYYRRRDTESEQTGTTATTSTAPTRTTPDTVSSVRSLAFRYPSLLECTEGELVDEPIAVDPERYRRTLEATRERLETRGRWESLCDPFERDRFARGRACRGIVHKVLTDPLAPSLLSAGEPPEQGVWEPQSVHAVAAAKALSWECQTPVEVAYLEYPAYGVIRRIDLTTRRKALYRRTLRTVRTLDGPPPRIGNRAKCESCEYAEECGVRTRTLRSLLGRGT